MIGTYSTCVSTFSLSRATDIDRLDLRLLFDRWTERSLLGLFDCIVSDCAFDQARSFWVTGLSVLGWSSLGVLCATALVVGWCTASPSLVSLSSYGYWGVYIMLGSARLPQVPRL